VSFYYLGEETMLELKCINPGCPEVGIVKELLAFTQLRATFLRRDEDKCCEDCGEDMSPAWCTTATATG
jgi:hypothetical protein